MHENGPLGEIGETMKEAAKASPFYVEDQTLIIAISSNGEDMNMSVSGLTPMRTFKLLMAAVETVITSMGGNMSIATVFGGELDD